MKALIFGTLIIFISGYNDTLTIEADIPLNWNTAFKKAMEAFER